jgi:hypothetical protein
MLIVRPFVAGGRSSTRRGRLLDARCRNASRFFDDFVNIGWQPRIARLFARQTAELSLLIEPKALRARLARPFDVDELTAGLSNETFLAAHP